MDQGDVPGQDFEAVFVDHGTDWPETYEYMTMMQAKEYPVTIIRPDVGGVSSIYDESKKYSIFPSRQRRWCTSKFKIKVLIKYYQKPCIELIGFDIREKNRRNSIWERDGVVQEYPLIEANIDREDCEEIIRRHGLPIPPKSGCYICPFQTRKQWIELKRKHPDLFCRAIKLENSCNERLVATGKEPAYFKDIPLETLVLPKDSRGRRAVLGAGTLIDPDFDRPPCRCTL